MPTIPRSSSQSTDTIVTIPCDISLVNFILSPNIMADLPSYVDRFLEMSLDLPLSFLVTIGLGTSWEA